MTTYKIHSDDAFAEVHPDLKKISIDSPDRDIIVKAIRECSSYKGGWVDLDGIIEEKNKPIPDITRLTGPDLVLSPAAYERLESELSKYGEFQAVHLDGQTYRLFRCLNRIDKVDEKNSSLDEYDEVSKLSFLAEDIKSHLMWTTHFGYGDGLFCSNEFEEIIKKSTLSGLTFNENLASLN